MDAAKAQDLDLSCHKIEVLPSYVLSLTCLVRLDCRKNSLRTLPKALEQLQNLRELNVCENELKALPGSIGSLKKLCILKAAKNQIQILPFELSELLCLRILELGDNPLIGSLKQQHNHGILHLQSYLNACAAMKLDLLKISTQDLIAIEQKQAICQPDMALEIIDRTLKGADVTGNADLSRLGLHQLRSGHFQIHRDTRLSVLNLKRNRFAQLPCDIWSWETLVELRTLDLSYNQLTHLPKGISILRQLIVLNLSHNILADLPLEISDLKCLQTLDASDNQLETIPIEIQSMPQLRCLTASRNIVEFNMQRAPLDGAPQEPSLDLTRKLCERLQSRTMSMTLYANLSPDRVTFTQTHANLKTFPSHMNSMAQLRVLDLSNNRLEKIPAELNMLSHLHRLILKHNEISCSGIPIELSQCKALTVLDLAYNQLTGLEPFLQFKSLRRLDVSFNQITNVSNELTQLDHLESIALVGNSNLCHLEISVGKDGGYKYLKLIY